MIRTSAAFLAVVRKFSIKKVLYAFFVLFVFGLGIAQAKEVLKGKGDEHGAYFSTDFGDVQVFGDFGGYAYRQNGDGSGQSSYEYESSYISFFYRDLVTGHNAFLNLWDSNNPGLIYVSKSRKAASLLFDGCNPDGYCGVVQVDLIGAGDLINEPWRDSNVFDCTYYRFQSVSPYRLATGSVTYEVRDPSGALLLEGSQLTRSAQINAGMYTSYQSEIPDCGD